MCFFGGGGSSSSSTTASSTPSNQSSPQRSENYRDAQASRDAMGRTSANSSGRTPNRKFNTLLAGGATATTDTKKTLLGA